MFNFVNIEGTEMINLIMDFFIDFRVIYWLNIIIIIPVYEE